MSWDVEYTNEFGEWWQTLIDAQQDDVTAGTELLLESGPHLGFPHSSSIEGSKHSHMRELRARETITSHFRIPSSRHLEPTFTRTILNVGFATLAVLLHQIDSICPKSGREFLEVIVSRALSRWFFTRHVAFSEMLVCGGSILLMMPLFLWLILPSSTCEVASPHHHGQNFCVVCT